MRVPRIHSLHCRTLVRNQPEKGCKHKSTLKLDNIHSLLNLWHYNDDYLPATGKLTQEVPVCSVEDRSSSTKLVGLKIFVEHLPIITSLLVKGYITNALEVTTLSGIPVHNIIKYTSHQSTRNTWCLQGRSRSQYTSYRESRQK